MLFYGRVHLLLHLLVPFWVLGEVNGDPGRIDTRVEQAGEESTDDELVFLSC